jgi:transcriptional regulator with XRE-family HTH domain
LQKSVHSRAYKALCRELVAARHAAGLTQTELAKRLKRPQSFVAKYEGGERRLDLVEAIFIAEKMGADMTHLVRAIRREMNL